MKRRNTQCTAEMPSLTQALRAEEALALAAIPSRVTKLETSSRRGCVYGISFACAQESNVRMILQNAGIPIKSIASEE